jgi:hypothetical protein
MKKEERVELQRLVLATTIRRYYRAFEVKPCPI